MTTVLARCVSMPESATDSGPMSAAGLSGTGSP